jgi:GNAT superfamily N-acetyltransferase
MTVPNARVRIFPDAGHGFLFQWPTEFAKLVNTFLEPLRSAGCNRTRGGRPPHRPRRQAATVRRVRALQPRIALSPIPLSDQEAAVLTAAIPDGNRPPPARGIQAVDPHTDDGVGVARFVRSPEDPSLAEVAVAVDDEWQGRGLGTVLLHDLAARAREEGIKRFSASMLAENEPMIGAFHKLGDVRVTGPDTGVVELLIELPG